VGGEGGLEGEGGTVLKARTGYAYQDADSSGGGSRVRAGVVAAAEGQAVAQAQAGAGAGKYTYQDEQDEDDEFARFVVVCPPLCSTCRERRLVRYEVHKQCSTIIDRSVRTRVVCLFQVRNMIGREQCSVPPLGVPLSRRHNQRHAKLTSRRHETAGYPAAGKVLASDAFCANCARAWGPWHRFQACVGMQVSGAVQLETTHFTSTSSELGRGIHWSVLTIWCGSGRRLDERFYWITLL
jgi:hypothetical protein